MGSNTVVTNGRTGAVHPEQYVDPFGERLGGGAPVTSYLFTDQENDAETSLDYFGARFYDSWAGRFMSQDPSLVHGRTAFRRIPSDGQYINAYSYVLNRPTILIDPTGMLPCLVSCTDYAKKRAAANRAARNYAKANKTSLRRGRAAVGALLAQAATGSSSSVNSDSGATGGGGKSGLGFSNRVKKGTRNEFLQQEQRFAKTGLDGGTAVVREERGRRTA